MKKRILLTIAVSATVAGLAQNARRIPANAGAENQALRIAHRLQAEAAYHEQSTASPSPSGAASVDEGPVASKTSSYTSSWKTISNSLNAFGVAVGTTRPLQYNEDLNAVSFILRAGPGYVASPAPAQTAASGVLVGLVSQNWGSTWDSTCMWNDNANWARYPQGAILNSAAGNTNIANASLVGIAPVTTQNSGWAGNAFAVKSLSAYSNVAPNTATAFPALSAALSKTDFSAYDCQVTDDGKIIALGYVNNDPNGNTAAVFGYRGASVVKGRFVAGNMVWQSDSIIPSVLVSGGSKALIARPRMAWSEDGQIGYVMHIGVASTATLSNRGFQPIIHRTSDGGVSWAPVSGIDFEAPSMSVALNTILSTRSNSNIAIPFFDYNEGQGLTVDKDGKLHIASLLMGSFSPHVDSTGFTYILTHSDGEQYSYGHQPGLRPYLFDFCGDGLPNSPWKATLVDSLSSEGAGTDPVNDSRGYSTNPWAEYDGKKLGVESRIQLSRTPDGRFLVYSWADSDTTLTSTGQGGLNKKWNELPDIKCRLMDVSTYSVHNVKINVTRPGAANPFIASSPQVSSRAYLHYISPKCALAQTTPVGPSGPALVMPITTSRPYLAALPPDSPTAHRYMSALLNFGGLTQGSIQLPGTTTGISENRLASLKAGNVYPNPASGAAQVSFNLKEQAHVSIEVLNSMGQLMRREATAAKTGDNLVEVNVQGLPAGVYFLKMSIGNDSATHKLVVN